MCSSVRVNGKKNRAVTIKTFHPKIKRKKHAPPLQLQTVAVAAALS
jgi:hypothetical protein